jgi:hypothetical protein
MSGLLAFDEGGVALVHCLFRQVQPVRDLAPRPPELTGAPHLLELQLVGELPQRGRGLQADRGVDVSGLSSEFRDIRHAVKIS